jgi:6,7-dimethyl-8-ribityllumazine synthase
MSLDAPVPLARGRKAYSIGIAAARFNAELVDGLLARAIAVLGEKPQRITVVRVPGSHEVPWAIQALAHKIRPDCLIGLGVLIAGETNHHEMVGNSVSAAFQTISIRSGIPVINGVIVANSVAQARARCLGKINRGEEFAHAALEMAALKRKLIR